MMLRLRTSWLLQSAWSSFHLNRYSSSLAPTCVPVVIVGAGPTGLVLSSLLSQYGIQHMLLEKSAGLTQHPQAHYINNRTMEVFRGVPGLAQQVSELSPPLSEWRRFIYCESMISGQLLGEVDHFPGQVSACDAAVSPEPVAHLSQHRLAQLLLDKAQQLAKGAGASIQFNTQVDSVSLVSFPHQQQPQHHQHKHHLQQLHPPSAELQHPPVSATSAASGRDAVHSEDAAAQEFPVCVAVTDHSQQQLQQQQQLVRCQYLVAADGSHSTIRRLLGIQMRGQAGMQHLISIHFSWPLLGQVLLARGREAMLYFVFNSSVVAVLVAHKLEAGEFVAQVPYFPPLQSPSQFTPELCQELIQAAAGFTPQQQQQQQQQGSSASCAHSQSITSGAGGGSGGLRVHSIKNWTMSAEVAEEYAAWGNRLLLAGDAAHRFPPAGGFGMNTGIQDAHNLAWKLAAVLTDRADPALLATYQPERKPVAQANADLSVNNWHEAIRVPQALGLDPGAASLVNKVVTNVPLPAPMASWLLDAALTAGRGLANAVIPLRRGALQDILASGMSLRLQFPREDLGFVYTQGAVDAGNGSDGQQQQQGQGGRDVNNSSSSGKRSRSNVYVPAVVVGGRLPHCWLQVLGPGSKVRKVSTLDLCTADSLGLNMLLMCMEPSSTTSSSSHGWVSAGLQLQSQGWPLKVLQLLPPASKLPTTAAAGAAVGAQASAAQAFKQAVDVDGTWGQLQAACGSAAVLVRPDGHIAWMAAPSSSSSSSEEFAGCSESSVRAQQQQQRELVRVLRDVLCLTTEE